MSRCVAKKGNYIFNAAQSCHSIPFGSNYISPVVRAIFIITICDFKEFNVNEASKTLYKL